MYSVGSVMNDVLSALARKFFILVFAIAVVKSVIKKLFGNVCIFNAGQSKADILKEVALLPFLQVQVPKKSDGTTRKAIQVIS